MLGHIYIAWYFYRRYENNVRIEDNELGFYFIFFHFLLFSIERVQDEEDKV